MRGEEPNMYGAIATIRNGEATLRWTRMQVFLFFNSIAIPVLTRTELGEGGKLALSAVGLAMCLIWFMVTMRAQELLDFWDESMRLLELVDINQQDPKKSQPRVLVFSSRRYRLLNDEWMSFHFILYGITVVAMFVWASLLLSYLALLTF
jgi:hypothetical protein